MQLWLIPTFYAAASIAAGFLVPRLEARYLDLSLNLSTSSAQAYLSAVASGMMALTGIVFSIAFVLVQFNAIVFQRLFYFMFCFVGIDIYRMSIHLILVNNCLDPCSV